MSVLRAPVFPRYVDDILLKSGGDVEKIANYFSQNHVKIEFTFEVQIDFVLPFLDVSFYRDANSFFTTVQGKDTFSGVLTNLDAFLPDV